MKIIWAWVVSHPYLAVTIILGIFEAVVRAIPTVGNYSIIRIPIEFLKWLSDYLNNKKK